jgi:hypothetical protein
MTPVRCGQVGHPTQAGQRQSNCKHTSTGLPKAHREAECTASYRWRPHPARRSEQDQPRSRPGTQPTPRTRTPAPGYQPTKPETCQHRQPGEQNNDEPQSMARAKSIASGNPEQRTGWCPQTRRKTSAEIQDQSPVSAPDPNQSRIDKQQSCKHASAPQSDLVNRTRINPVSAASETIAGPTPGRKPAQVSAPSGPQDR